MSAAPLRAEVHVRRAAGPTRRVSPLSPVAAAGPSSSRRVRRPTSGPGSNLNRMPAEPVQVGDPNDPEVIVRDLPEQERAEFLRQYHEAVDASRDPLGYRQLQRLLHAWRLTVIATSRAGYYEELAAVRSGREQARPAEEAFPDWQELLAAARAQSQPSR
jgi:hypothetical protein